MDQSVNRNSEHRIEPGSVSFFCLSQHPQGLIAGASDATAPFPCQVFGWMIHGQDFASAIAEGCPVKAGYDFTLTISQEVVVHKIGQRSGHSEEPVNLGGGEQAPAICLNPPQIERVRDFAQSCKAGDLHYFGDNLAELGVAFGGERLPRLIGLRD